MQETIASPETFTAVLIISNNLSTPIISAMPSTGKPTCCSTIANMINPTPGTPAVPIEAKVAVKTTIKYSENDKSTENA